MDQKTINPYPFFSFIIPAYNEASVIERTLACLRDLEYPKDRYEAVVVENGSTDDTYQRAVRFASPHIKVVSSEKGVSRARNFGKTQARADADWYIFMDADVFLGTSFLEELRAHLASHPDASYGTASIWLESDRRLARWISQINIFSFRLSKFLYTIHIVRNDLAAKTAYHENLTSGEDVVYGKALAKLGVFFYMPTRSALTSARRYEKRGYFPMLLSNTFHGLLTVVLPERLMQKVKWEPIR